MSKLHGRIKSFGFAFEGIKSSLKNEPNFRIHIVSAIAASGLAYFLKFSAIEWSVLVFTIASVMIVELINTSVESVTNLLSPDIQQSAKTAKDVAAAAVLVSSVGAVIIGAILFLPKIFLLI